MERFVGLLVRGDFVVGWGKAGGGTDEDQAYEGAWVVFVSLVRNNLVRRGVVGRISGRDVEASGPPLGCDSDT